MDDTIQKQDNKGLEERQCYKFGDTEFAVESVFKKDGKRTLLHSLGKIIEKDLKEF